MTRHRDKMRDLLVYYSGKSRTLAEISGKGLLNRSVRTLKKYAREFDITFSDHKRRTKDGNTEAGHNVVDPVGVHQDGGAPEGGRGAGEFQLIP
jgi:hypothetical protein